MRQPVPFGKYLLLDRISVGGMAEVFKAKSYGVEGFEKIIAIKRILPTMGEDRDFIKMFIDEAKIAGQLAHANICQIFELGRIDGSHFIAMEYIWGKDLLQIQNRLRKIKQPMPVAMACFIIAKVLEGLDYAHRKRDPLGRPLEIVHRDCSPQNVLVSYEGEVKVIDFGIAKATSRNSRTMAGVLKGKFGYMSPEQVRGLPLDRRSDLFALGTMLYECLTSERLFQGETDFSTLEKVRNVDIRPPREINPNIPDAVERVILKALSKDVEDRYQWCSEMLADLQQYLMSQDVVFTAKSLSGWLKEVFSQEIERERQQLEQYKRVGRDGLIAGVPSAEASRDVVAGLGEAGAPEGDATQLGGPNFEDLEHAAGAAPEIGPAPGSPAARGGSADDDESDNGDFGEEAPTEIFGEIDGPGGQQPAPQQQRPNASNPAMAGNRPSKPAPNSPVARAATQRPSDPPYAGQGAARGSGGSMPMAASAPNDKTLMAPGSDKTMNLSDSDILLAPGAAEKAREAFAASFPQLAGHAPAHASPQQGYAAQGYNQQGYGANQSQPMGPMGMAAGTPNAVPSQPMNALVPPGAANNQGKTLMGAAPPPGVPNYSHGYPPQQQMYGTQPPQMSYPQQGQYPSQPQMQVYPPGHPMAGMPAPQYGQYGAGPAVAVDHGPPVDGKRKSSIGRDVAIGVAIAALVLGGFLAVKFLVLDKSDDAQSSTSTESAIATIRIAMPDGISAELFLDDKRVATVSNKQEINVNSGLRKVKLLGPNNTRCESEMKLPGGKTTTVECIIDAGAGGSAAIPATGSGTGSATPATGSAGSATTAGVGQTSIQSSGQKGSADTTRTDLGSGAAAKDKTVDKSAADKAAADKAAADKAARDKAAKDKAARDKMPVEENPADKALAQPTKGYLNVFSKPSAKILIDGKDTGFTTPVTGKKLELDPGRHKVTFMIGTDKHTFPITIKAGETAQLSKDLQ